MVEILIKGGTIIDGTGRRGIPGDVAVDKGRIVGIGNIGDVKADRTVDAKGKIVAPGFIDIHTHADTTVLVHPNALSSITQGITTEVISNCGSSLAPKGPGGDDRVIRRIRSRMGDDVSKADLNWNTLAEFLDTLERHGLGENVIMMMGQGTARAIAMGEKAMGPASPTELESMKSIVAQAMEEGAWGVSTGLTFAPGCYAATPEITELAKVASKYGGRYFTHVRMFPNAGQMVWCIEEAVRIAREADLPLQVAHLVASTASYNFAFKRASTPEAIKILEDASKDGVRLYWDVYPYNNSSVNRLRNWLSPSFARFDKPSAMAHLKKPETRSWLQSELLGPEEGWYVGKTDWILALHIVNCPSKPELVGQRIWSLVVEASKTKDPVNFLCDLVIQHDDEISCSAMDMSDENIDAALRHPLGMPSSDGWALDRPLPAPYVAHPRHAGSMVRFLGKYWRKRKICSLEEAIHKMTALPALSIGLQDRGTLLRGNWADVVVFDPDTVEDRATFADPYLRPVGIETVLVNGKFAVDGGQPTGTLAGRALRHGQA